jgi:D-amino-acid oxidase
LRRPQPWDSLAYRDVMDVTVIGAGVSGLTTAVALSQSGHRVSIRAAAPFTDTVSRVAAAVWTITDTPPTLLVGDHPMGPPP